MASSSIKLKLLAWLLINLSLSSSMHVVVSASTYVSFSLTHRDAERSPLRSAEADPADLPEDMPMRAFVAAGRALTKRLDMQSKLRKGDKALVGKTSYAGEKQGDFYLTVPVGTPSQNIFFLLDTGSEFIWAQCSPCLNCTKTTARRFAYNQSSSFLVVASDSELCLNSVGLHRFVGPELCQFAVSYGDGSEEQGFLSLDTFNLGPTFSKPFVFGCATFVNETVFTPSSGLMGLDAGPFSFTSQLFASNPDMPKKFAYCLPDRIKSLNIPGRIEFGNYKQPAKVRYTPLAAPYGPLGSLYYYVKLEGIAVGETVIKVENMEAAKGTIFDSGSSITSLVKPLYDEMVREMKRQTAHLGPVELDGGSILCYEAPLNATEPPKVPRISMHFAGGVELELVPASILSAHLVISNGPSTLFCLAFQSTAEDQVSIIGNYQQQNYWVEHNLETSSLGLAKAKCANY